MSRDRSPMVPYLGCDRSATEVRPKPSPATRARFDGGEPVMNRPKAEESARADVGGSTAARMPSNLNRQERRALKHKKPIRYGSPSEGYVIQRPRVTSDEL